MRQENSRDAVSGLDDDEISDVGLTDTRSKGGSTQRRTFTVVNESGLYGLIMQSRKPEAKPFRKWVTKEVLPTLRKTGIYALQGSLLRNGVDGILYKETKLYPYKEMLLALGFSNGSGAARKRKKTYSAFLSRHSGGFLSKRKWSSISRRSANRPTVGWRCANNNWSCRLAWRIRLMVRLEKGRFVVEIPTSKDLQFKTTQEYLLYRCKWRYTHPYNEEDSHSSKMRIGDCDRYGNFHNGNHECSSKMRNTDYECYGKSHITFSCHRNQLY